MQASRRGGRLSTQHLHRGASFGQGFGPLRVSTSPSQETFLYQVVYIYLLKTTDIRPADQSLFDRRDVLAIHALPCVFHNFPTHPRLTRFDKQRAAICDGVIE